MLGAGVIPDLSMNLKVDDIYKRAIFKVAVELVKADGRIDQGEVALLSELQRSCGIATEELDMIHYISLEQAVRLIGQLPAQQREEALQIAESIIGIDKNIDHNENRLFTSLKLALSQEHSSWYRIISTTGCQSEVPSNQAIYLEQSYCPATHKILDDRYNYLLISKILGDAQLSLFYLPTVISELFESWTSGDGESNFDLLRRSMEFISPAGDHHKITNLAQILDKLDIPMLYKIVCSRYHISPEQIGFRSHIMIKIHEGYLLDDDEKLSKSVDFLCIDTSDCAIERLLRFSDMLSKPRQALCYEGYHRILYDYLSSEARVLSSISISAEYEFRLRELELRPIRIESAPQAKTLYLLLLKYGKGGISQELFDKALLIVEEIIADKSSTSRFDFEQTSSQLGSSNDKARQLVYNIMTIYAELSTKSCWQYSFMGYVANIIRHRSSLKNYINTTFQSIDELADSDTYCIKFSVATRSYYISADRLLYTFESGGRECSLGESSLFNKLK